MKRIFIFFINITNSEFSALEKVLFWQDFKTSELSIIDWIFMAASMQTFYGHLWACNQMGFIWIGASKACKKKIATFRAEVKTTFYVSSFCSLLSTGSRVWECKSLSREQKCGRERGSILIQSKKDVVLI